MILVWWIKDDLPNSPQTFPLYIYYFNNVNVGPPMIYFISNDTVSQEGDKVNLICIAINDVDAIHLLHVNWYKGNTLVIPNGKRILLYNETDDPSRQLNSTLLLDPVKRIDDGEYTCRAFNHPNSYSESKTNLIVQCKVTI